MLKKFIQVAAAAVLVLMPSALASPMPDGYGAVVTGGTGGTAVTADTSAKLIQYVQNSGAAPYIIMITSSFTITGGIGTSGGAVYVRSNKTIQGIPGVVIEGTFDLGTGSTDNVIIQNLSITNPNNIG